MICGILAFEEKWCRKNDVIGRRAVTKVSPVGGIVGRGGIAGNALH